MRVNSIVFFLYFLSSALAQGQQQKLPLRELLRKLEQQYAISFTYSDRNVDGVLVDPPPPSASLEGALTFLSSQTGLTFTQLNPRFIAISKPATNELLNLCGIIVDQQTNEKIEGATIQSNDQFAVSNSSGYFELNDLKEGNSIIVKSLGYEPQYIDVNGLKGMPCIEVRLKLSSYLLAEVIIANYITTGIKKNIDGSLTIQTTELGILPGLTEPDVLFTLQALPGIQSIDETVSNINVRGGTHDQNLVLWDGMKMYQQGHFFGLISAFNPYLTKEVSLVKNGTSAMYSDGVSSTIDIRSDDEVAKRFSGSAGMNMIDADVLTKIPVSSKSSLHLSARRSIADIIETPTYRAYFDRAFRDTDVTNSQSVNNDTIATDRQFSFYDFSMKYLHDISRKDKLRVSFLNIHNSIEYEETGIVNGVQESKTSSLEQENLVGGMFYSRLWNPKVKTTGQWYVSKYNLNGINNDILNGQQLKQDNEVIDMGVKLDAQLHLSDRFGLLSGYQFFEVGVSNLEDIDNPPFYRRKKTVLLTHVLFTEAAYTSPNGETTIRAGLRGNYFSKFNKFRIEPRLAISQKVNESLSLEAHGEMKSQTTTQVIEYQNDFLGIEKRRWVMSNEEDIPVIESMQLSTGMHYQKNDFLISMEAYGKRVNGITTSSQGFQNQFQYVRSSGSYTTYGFDFLANKRVSRFNSWLSYSLAKSTYTFDELVPSSFRSNLDVRHRLTAGLSYQSKRFDFSFGANWHTGRPFTKPMEEGSTDNGNILYQDPNTASLDNYWRFDVSAVYKFQLSETVKAIAGFSIWNLFDHDNIIDSFYQLEPNNEVTLAERQALDLTLNAMFRVQF